MKPSYILETGTINFTSVPYGHSYSPSGIDAPDYPWDFSVVDSKNVYTSQGGLRWMNRNYQRVGLTLHFEAVGTDCVGTMGSLALSGTSFTFSILNGAVVAYTGEMRWAGERWSPEAVAKGIWNFDFEMVEVL